MYSRYESKDEDEDDDEFFFDSDLNLEAAVDDNIVAVEAGEAGDSGGGE